MRITLNEVIIIVDAFVEQTKKLGDQTIQEEWNEEKKELLEGLDAEDINEEVEINAERIVSIIQGIDLKSEEEA